MFKDIVLGFTKAKSSIGFQKAPPTRPVQATATAPATRNGSAPSAGAGSGTTVRPLARPVTSRPTPRQAQEEDDAPSLGFGAGKPASANDAPPNTQRFGVRASQRTARPDPAGPPPPPRDLKEPTAPQVTLRAILPASSEGRDLVVQPEEAIPSRSRRILASEAELRLFLEYSGEVLTSPNGPLNSSDAQRQVTCAIMDSLGKDPDSKEAYARGDGQDVILLVPKNNAVSPLSDEVRNAIRGRNLRIKQEYLVELETIRKVHEGAEQRVGGGRSTRGRGGEALQAMQHGVLDLIAEAAARRGSDIHVTVGRYEAQIRMRVDGVMENVRQVPAAWAAELCASAFNMADASDASYRNLDYQGARISEIRTPLPKGVQSIRLQFNPLPNGGRYLIARLLYATSAADSGGDVNTLGYGWSHVEQINEMRRKPFGINVICGPTGSGKSTTLQRALTALMREKRNQINVITIEDPPEYVIEGAAQLPVTNAATDEERKEKFRAAIAASLRSDPDVIMIGEIRDAASSGLAFAAAMTGHQVWASLHANDAISILDRFLDQGVEVYKLSDHTLITGLIGQRLIRSVCPRCAIQYGDAKKRGLIEPHIAFECERVASGRLDDVRVANPSPPKDCGCRAGYKGRQVIAETIVPNLDFMKFVRKGEKEEAVAYWISELNGLTMLEHAGQKMVRGLCDPRDVADKAGDIKGIVDLRFDRVFGDLFEEKVT
jgi:general secretion pathway protein E